MQRHPQTIHDCICDRNTNRTHTSVSIEGLSKTCRILINNLSRNSQTAVEHVSNIYRTSSEHLSTIYGKSCGSLVGRFCLLRTTLKESWSRIDRTCIETLSEAYRMSINNLSNIWWTSIEYPTEIYRICRRSIGLQKLCRTTSKHLSTIYGIHFQSNFMDFQ